MGVPSDRDPGTYLERIRADTPCYDELQVAAIEAIPFPPERVLDLGTGIGETSRRLLETYPSAHITGLDSSPDMLFRARELGIETRLARMEDPLPDGPWDLVIAVLSVHELTSDGKRELMRRVREQSRSVVIGDVVETEPQLATRQPGTDFPQTAEELAKLVGGQITWEQGVLAVASATLEGSRTSAADPSR